MPKTNKIKEFLQLKKNPAMGILKVLDDFRQNFRQEAIEIVKQEIKSTGNDMTINQQVEKIVDKAVRRILGEIKGDIGDIGETGDKGEKGSSGMDGSDGKDGINGKNGVNGTNGVNGRDGIVGKPGRDGEDGTKLEPEEITRKINKTSKSIDITVLRGLDSFIKKMLPKGTKGGGGGGFGKPIHQTFNVSSATTTVTLSNDIAAEGNAIWLFYQGQFLVKDNHYTVSGKTLTFNETFADSTFVDCTYIRT